MSEGLVVASCGLYLPMVAKSPESQTTVCGVAMLEGVWFWRRTGCGGLGRVEGSGWRDDAYRAGCFELFKRGRHDCVVGGSMEVSVDSWCVGREESKDLVEAIWEGKKVFWRDDV